MKKKVSADEMRRRQRQSQGSEFYCDGSGAHFQMKKSKRVKRAYEIITDDLIWETNQTLSSRRSPLPL